MSTCDKECTKENCLNCRYYNWEYTSCILNSKHSPDEHYIDVLKEWEEQDKGSYWDY